MKREKFVRPFIFGCPPHRPKSRRPGISGDADYVAQQRRFDRQDEQICHRADDTTRQTTSFAYGCASLESL